ncbi:MAG: hypothetical protein KDA76_19360 [Planctomycetaceae bacterium]|nr:hypothetical protein [Planctomycetaceae bacterium]
MARRQRDLGLERRWRERLASWRASGLNVRAFCLRHGLTETSFYYWKRELRTREAAASHGSGVTRGGEACRARSAFVPLTVIPATTLAVEVRCPSGHVVCLAACDVSTLASVFAALQPTVHGEPAC